MNIKTSTKDKFANNYWVHMAGLSRYDPHSLDWEGQCDDAIS
jgi:hypothetical protein